MEWLGWERGLEPGCGESGMQGQMKRGFHEDKEKRRGSPMKSQWLLPLVFLISPLTAVRFSSTDPPCVRPSFVVFVVN